MTGHLDLASPWGPFSPNYLGAAHVADPTGGIMLDLPVFVGRTEPPAVVLPDAAFDHVQNMASGDRRARVTALPENVAPDYSRFAIRYFLDPHGDSALARFTPLGRDRLRLEIDFHNTSAAEREYFFGIGVAVNDPAKKVRLQPGLAPWWVAARDYAEISAYQKVFGLGCRQCLTRVFTWCVEDEVLAQAFGGWKDDCVTYRASLPSPLANGYVYARYVKYSALEPEWELEINGRTLRFRFPQTAAIPGGGWGKNRDEYPEWMVLGIPIGPIADPKIEMRLRCIEAPGNDTTRVWLDGFLFHEGPLPGQAGPVSPASLIDAPLDFSSRVETLPGTSFLAVTAEGNRFGIRLDTEGNPGAQAAGTGSLLEHLRSRFQLPEGRLKRDGAMAPWGLWLAEPLPVAAKSLRTVAVDVHLEPAASGSSPQHLPTRSTSPPLAPPAAPPVPDLNSDAPFAEMSLRLRDILLFNVNYPLKIFGRASHYVVPSKYFPLPYSWDGGFTAVGMATFAPDFAWQQTTYFFADPGHEFPQLICGSPVPTPLYALWEVFQQTGDLVRLRGAYAGAKRMYDFYLGRTPGSEVNPGGDGLLTTYAYNYNLGIDDHPIQRWAEENNVTQRGLYSIILIPQIRRLACVMRNIARLLGEAEDVARFGEDAALLAGVIDGRMWDERSGLYGWLQRTQNGVEPVVLDGCAGDRSACAFLPLFAGLTTHKTRLLKALRDPRRFFTPHGISSVDMLAPSYNPNGYWNGGIWPVLQWYLWKGLLESGEPELAREIALRILGTWQRFFETEHYFGEHYMIAMDQMNGAPNFGGLGAVLLPMRAAYFEPYCVTPCYDVQVLAKSVDRERDRVVLTLAAPFLESKTHDLLLNMGRAHGRYCVRIGGRKHATATADEWGHLRLCLPHSAKSEVVVEPEGA